MSDTGLPCPVPGCLGRMAAPHHTLCPDHWRGLPTEVRIAVHQEHREIKRARGKRSKLPHRRAEFMAVRAAQEAAHAH